LEWPSKELTEEQLAMTVQGEGASAPWIVLSVEILVSEARSSLPSGRPPL
jgi:hypothetical protein